jgi:small subunit ribosomal protein S18
MAEEIVNDEVEEAVEEAVSSPQAPQPTAPPKLEDNDAAEEVVEASGDDPSNITFTEGPTVFFRTKDGRRRNPRYVGNEVKLEDIDYKKVTVLSRFVDDRGRIYSRRKTRVSAKMQRKVSTAIKRARHLALMPYTGEHVRITRKSGA